MVQKQDVKTVVEEHVTNMNLPQSTGQHILDAIAVVEEYLKNQKEIARINAEADKSEEAVKDRMREFDLEYLEKQQALDRERNGTANILNRELSNVKDARKADLKPLYDRITQVKRIIAMLRVAETIQPVNDIGNSEITTYHGEYLEMLGYLYIDDYLKIRLLITENRKPKNKYSLLAYGRCAFEDQSLLRRFYEYGTPNLNDSKGGFNVLYELGSFPSIPDAKAYAQKSANKPLKQFIADFVNLKQEYLEVTGTYKLSDFERITAEDKKEGSK